MPKTGELRSIKVELQMKKFHTGKKAIPTWFLVTALAIAGAGATLGVILSGNITSQIPVAVSEALLIDAENFGVDDLSAHAARRFVSVSDDRASFTAAAEIRTGEELAIDVPLINQSNSDLTAELMLEAPSEIEVWAEPFWTTETIDFSRAEGTITETTSMPSPQPFTQVTPRIFNLTVTSSAPSGVAPITTQRVNTTATATRPPGAPDSRSGTWYTGTFLVDLNGDGVKENVYFVLTDNAAAGVYNTMDLSTDDTTFGETLGGLLNNGMTGPDDDERITETTDVCLGPFYAFTVAFDSNPAANTDDARITSKTWFIITVTGTDLDGEGVADDTFYVALTDDDSDGIYEKLDISIGDNVFGEGNLGDLIVNFTPGDPPTDNTNDERLTAASETTSGTFNIKLGTYTFTFSFDTTPGGGP